MRHKKRKQASSQTIIMLMVVAVGLALLIVLVSSQVFAVRDILVVGNRNLLREEVITQSGILIGDNLLSLSDDTIKARLERNRYIEYVGHEFDYNGTLTLNINERMGTAVIRVFGLYYVMDASGMVLECTGSAYPEKVPGPKVNGFVIDSNSRIQVGMPLPAANKLQVEAMKGVITALDEAKILDTIAVLDITSLTNMYAMTRDGAKIVIGDDRNLTAKMLIAREVLNIRAPMGNLKGAKIDVSSGKNAHYIPDVLPTVTPVMTPTPTIEPEKTPS